LLEGKKSSKNKRGESKNENGSASLKLNKLTLFQAGKLLKSQEVGCRKGIKETKMGEDY